jgi:hypothetical protein
MSRIPTVFLAVLIYQMTAAQLFAQTDQIAGGNTTPQIDTGETGAANPSAKRLSSTNHHPDSDHQQAFTAQQGSLPVDLVNDRIEGTTIDGFENIFDGRTLQGWRSVPDGTLNSDWKVDDGVIVGTGTADRLVYLVYKEEQLVDFELKLQYRLKGKGNTGVEIRAQHDKTGKRPFLGYHADLGHVGIGDHILGAWDFHFAGRKEYSCKRAVRLLIDQTGATSRSEIDNPFVPADIRENDWNRVHIIANGNKFQFRINGKIASQFMDNATSERLDSGAIGLQIHDKGMSVEFKDIKLKKLNRS